MSRATIDIGIDLGTTNSAIAVIQNGIPYVVPDNGSRPTTPSVVRFTASGTKQIGHPAYGMIVADPDNTAAGFKRWMGRDDVKRFAATDIEMTAPQLSAEILSALRDNVQQYLRESVTAAVITVPAAFDLNQTAATQEAARLAGITSAPLLQEPIAASLAYGFRMEMDGRNWLVYDLGGGTFDLALVGVRDGRVQVIDHEGDNFLGGTDLDWVIVEEILVPRLSRNYSVNSFQRSNPDRRAALGKLKVWAELAKIELSRLVSATVMIETLREPLLDDADREIETELVIQREEYERAISRLVDRTIELSRNVLDRNGGIDVEAVLLVGGPTLTPLIRTQVSEVLGIPTNTTANPMTAVAEGAALFAATQPLTERPKVVVNSGSVTTIDVVYKSVTDAGSILVGLQCPNSVASVELTATDNSWSSGQLSTANGRTSVRVPLPHRGAHTFRLVARGRDGSTMDTDPKSITITRAITAGAAPLAKTFGVVVDDGTGDHFVDALINKNSPLPARKTETFRSSRILDPSGFPDSLRIYIVEGENPRASRNRRVGEIVIANTNLSRRLPAGNPIEITFEIDESRILKASAYVPMIDQSFTAEIQLGSNEISLSDMARDITTERERIAQFATYLPVSKVRELNERLKEVAADMRSAHGGDSDLEQRALRNLQEVQSAVDEIEDTQRIPMTVANARETAEVVATLVMDYGDDGYRARLRAIRHELDQAVDAHSVPEIRRAENKLNDLRVEVLVQQPWFWVGFFQHLTQNIHRWTDEMQAATLSRRGYEQLEREDIAGLSDTCRHLLHLVRPEDQARANTFEGVGIRR